MSGKEVLQGHESGAVEIVLIAAVARNGVIGVNGGMPWHIPSDFRHFRSTTMGRPLVMGRKQFETLGKPLPGRVNLVVSRQPGYQPDGVIVINDLDAALDHGVHLARAEGVGQVMVIGGGEIYSQAMGRADRLIISHVDMAPEPSGEADDSVQTVLFPAIDPQTWRVEREIDVVPDARDAAAYSIKVYVRKV